MRRLSLAKKLTTAVICVSSLGTAVGTTIELALSYQAGERDLDAQLSAFENTAIQGINRSVWLMDESGLKSQVEATLLIPEISDLTIRDESGAVLTHSAQSSKELQRKTTKTYRLLADDDKKFIGSAELTYTTDLIVDGI